MTKPLAKYSQARFAPKPPGKRRVRLDRDHHALVNGSTIFKSMRRSADDVPRLLIDGHNSRKIGKMVRVGRWAGARIYTLTLEERATCPKSCHHWGTCYGNNMQWSRRIIADDAFEWRLVDELAALQNKHAEDGFVVRLHMLGDFYSVAYVNLWRAALAEFPDLKCFGYTAHHSGSAIGRAVKELAAEQWHRFAIRVSRPFPIGEREAIPARNAFNTRHFICPAQTAAAKTCGTCAACWESNVNVAFKDH